jgi:uncharacterized protein (DUF2141 family)
MKNIYVVVFAFLMFLPLVAQAQLATLNITVSGLDPATGKVEVSLFNSEETFMKEAFRQQAIEVEENAELSFRFPGLLDGEYAVVVVHDENDNGVLDTGFLGLGGESYNFSNDAAPFLGRPGFAAASFPIGEDDHDITINLD